MTTERSPGRIDAETLKKCGEILPVLSEFFETDKRAGELRQRKKKVGY